MIIMSYTYSLDSFFPFVATSAAVAVGALVLLQTDKVSRKILKPSQLNKKRREEYTYNWKKSVDKVKLQIDYFFAGGPQKYNDDPECVMRNAEYIYTEQGLDFFIAQITDKKNFKYKYFTLKIDKDPHDPTDEIYLFIVREQQLIENENTPSLNRMLYQVPMVKFTLKLAKAFEEHLTAVTFCFVADASSGMASNMLELLVKEAKVGVSVVSEPFWMVQVARLAENKIISSQKIEKVIFALCRLDAWSMRHEVNLSDAKTVMFTLPGQTTVATLLPLIQNIFPEDRHIFAYDGCISTVRHAMNAERIFKRGQLFYNLELITQGMSQDPVRLSNPFPSSVPLSYDSSLGGEGGRLEQAFGLVPIQQARIVESWMSSVDAYFKLKEDESTNGYLPYCFKVGYLVGDPVGNFEYGTDSFWSLNSLLQYVTGCRSRSMPEGLIDAAKEWVKEYNEKQQMKATVVLTEYERKMIENCCFQHKQILIGNKTLKDTVLPRQHWSMKQASRAGCSCCGPDPYDEMEEEEEEEKIFDTGGSRANNNNNYVDGTTGFAFDPTRFS